jgi:tRNA threonylcarbamoyladenosine biosynthesis protein TsaE
MPIETISVNLSNEQKTKEFGLYLTNTIYRTPVTVLLDGALGAGKTTFLQGFAEGLGITERILSPTFALEQRYALPPKTSSAHVAEQSSEFLHLDLYRLTLEEAEALLRQTDDHEGIRCIEWASRAAPHRWKDALIRIRLQEEGDGRRCDVLFEDIAIPFQEQVEEWRREVLLPAHIASHCDTTAALCDALSANLLERGIAVRPVALRRAAQLHDLLRFTDFKEGAGPKEVTHTKEQLALWNDVRSRYGERHEEACALFLQERGFPAIAKIMETHGVHTPPPENATIEQWLLFYADKRAMIDRVVSIDERFADFARRYGGGTMNEQSKKWLEDAKNLEKRLFPNNVPLEGGQRNQ